MWGDEDAAPSFADAKEPMTESDNRHVDNPKIERQGLKSGSGPSIGAIIVIASLGLGSVLTLAWRNLDELSKRPETAWLVAHLSGRTIADKRLGEAERAILVGQNDEARTAYGEALALYKRADDRRGQAKALLGLGELESKEERADMARAAYSEALTLFKKEDNRLGQASVQFGLGEVERKLRRYDSARTAYREALILYKRADNPLGQANVQYGLGEMERKLGRNDAAQAAYVEALRLYLLENNRFGQANVQCGLGRLETRLGSGPIKLA